MGLTGFDFLPDRADAKITAYETKFIDAQGLDVAANDYLRPWIHEATQGMDPSVWKVEYPIPLSAAELKLFKGKRTFRSGATKFVAVTKATYEDGESEYYKKIAALDWVGFNTAPERLAYICKTWTAKNGCVLLNTGESVTGWNGTFLSATVSSNPFKRGGGQTFRTWWPATPLTHDNVLAMIADMCNRRGFQDDNLGLEGDTLFASAALYPLARTICEDERLATGETNPVKKWGLKPVKLMHLTATRWGLAHAAAFDRFPVFGAIEAPEDFETFGKGSAMFEQKAHMGYHVLKDLGITLLRNEALSVASTV